MRNWFTRIFGSGGRPATLVTPVERDRTRPKAASAASPAPVTAASSPAAPAYRPKPGVDATVSMLNSDDVEFLSGLAFPPEAKHLDELPRDDRFFLGGLVKRLHARQLEMPVFPEIAVRLTEMLRQSDLPVSRYVALLNEAPALSVEVLKVANSAFYGASRKTTSLNEAVLRIGLTRLQSILLMAHLKTRILKDGALQRKAELLLDLSLPMGVLAGRHARPDAGGADLRFMRGMLMHVEHLVILGAVTDVSREHRHTISPSVHAVLQAFDRFGPDIRQAVSAAWKLKDILIGGDEEQALAPEYAGLRQALICRWLDLPLPAVPYVDADRLADTMADIAPRVPPPEDEALSA